MNASLVLSWGLAWTIAALAVLLFTAWLAQRFQPASGRHLAWTLSFICIAMLPIFPAVERVLANAQLPANENSAAPSLSPNPTTDLCAPPPPPPSSLPSMLLTLWLAGTACTLARGAFAFCTVANWRRNSLHFHPSANLPPALSSLRLRIALSDSPAVPIIVGFLRPSILLPRTAAHWADARLSAVLWHELGHLRQRHHFLQLLALIISALHWFNPIVWFAARRLEAEAEMTADDFAVLRGIQPSSYAAQLLALASELQSNPCRSPVGHTAMIKPFTLEERLRSIISAKPRNPCAPFGKLVLIFAVITLILISLVPSLSATFKSASLGSSANCEPPKIHH